METLRLKARTRPVRAAFLIDPDTLPPEAFDALIEDCMGAWGGGYWPIVPTDGETVSEEYWRLLDLTDPDFITAAVPVSEDLQRDLERRLAPARLDIRPVSPDDAHPVVRTDWPLKPLDSTGVLRYHHRQAHLLSSDDPLVWFREQHTWPLPTKLGVKPSRPHYPAHHFVQRNFGYPRVSWPLEHELKTLPYREISLVDLTAAETLAELTEGRGVFYRALCRRHAPRPFSPDYVPSPAHVVVVGDSLSDAVRAWNRFVTSHPCGRALWIPEVLAGDAEFLDALGQWAERQWALSSNAPSGIHIESASVAPSDLAQLSEVLDKTQPTSVGSFEPGTLPFSGSPFLGTSWARPNHLPGTRSPHLVTQASAIVAGGEASITTTTPPVAEHGAAAGGWMVDLDIVDDVSPARYSNSPPRWRLPRRTHLVHPFLVQGAFPRAYRVVASGLPSLSATIDAPAVTLKIPNPWSVATALVVRSSPADEVAIEYVQVSEQGRRFRAAVELFGSIYQAGRYLSTAFWRDQLLRAAGDPVASRGEQAAIAHRLHDERAGRSNEQFIAELVSKLHRTQRRSGDSLSKRDFKAAYHRKVNETYSDQPKDQRPDFEYDGWPRFEWLVERGVFLQGADLRCPSCSLSRWHPVDALARTVQCPECLRPFALPADPGWSYRLNGLVRSAIADDAVLPVIDAAYTIAAEARTHALVFPPTDLFPPSDPFGHREASPFTDLDLLILRDGQLVVGEVKSTAGGFASDQLHTLGTVASAVGADEVVLAAPAATWTTENEAAATQAVTKTLCEADRVRVLRLEPDPYF